MLKKSFTLFLIVIVSLYLVSAKIAQAGPLVAVIAAIVSGVASAVAAVVGVIASAIATIATTIASIIGPALVPFSSIYGTLTGLTIVGDAIIHGIVLCATGVICTSGGEGRIVGVIVSTEASESECYNEISFEFYNYPALGDEVNYNVAIYRYDLPESYCVDGCNIEFISWLASLAGRLHLIGPICYSYLAPGPALGNGLSPSGSTFYFLQNNQINTVKYHQSGGESDPLRTIPYKDICIKDTKHSNTDVCTVVDRTVPENRLVVYFAKLLKTYQAENQIIKYSNQCGFADNEIAYNDGCMSGPSRPIADGDLNNQPIRYRASIVAPEQSAKVSFNNGFIQAGYDSVSEEYYFECGDQSYQSSTIGGNRIFTIPLGGLKQCPVVSYKLMPAIIKTPAIGWRSEPTYKLNPELNVNPYKESDLKMGWRGDWNMFLINRASIERYINYNDGTAKLSWISQPKYSIQNKGQRIDAVGDFIKLPEFFLDGYAVYYKYPNAPYNSGVISNNYYEGKEITPALSPPYVGYQSYGQSRPYAILTNNENPSKITLQNKFLSSEPEDLATLPFFYLYFNSNKKGGCKKLVNLIVEVGTATFGPIQSGVEICPIEPPPLPPGTLVVAALGAGCTYLDLVIESGGADSYDIFREGSLIAENVPGSTKFYRDTDITPRTNYQYTIKTKKGGVIDKTADVVGFTICPPECSFYASPGQVIKEPGKTPQSDLIWDCKYADSCLIDQSIGTVSAAGGAKPVQLEKTTTYTLSCKNDDGETNLQTKITVFKPGLREIIP